MQTKVIFLDIDGVVCTRRVHVAYKDSGTWHRPDPVAVRLLNRLCADTGAVVVISSSWRNTDSRGDIEAMLRRGGFSGRFHDDWATPSLVGGFRGDELAAWLAAHPETGAWVALDDGRDFHPGQNLVLTHGENGFMYEHYKAARAFLGSDDPWDAVVAGQLRAADDRLAATVREMAAAVRNGHLMEAARLADEAEALLEGAGR